MSVTFRFNAQNVDDYRQFLAIRRLPSYQFRGRAAVVSDEYAKTLGADVKPSGSVAFEPLASSYDYQRDIAKLAVRKKKFAIFADCGLGKTIMLLRRRLRRRRRLRLRLRLRRRRITKWVYFDLAAC